MRVSPAVDTSLTPASLALTIRRMAVCVLRVAHGGRDRQHRGRERALAAMGTDVTLVVPGAWPDEAAEPRLSPEAFHLVELPVRRAGDVNRHAYFDRATLRRIIDEARPDVLDIHEEPYSRAARQWLRAAPAELPVVMYSAQNVDKRYPPPFSAYERSALGRVAAFYPCCSQVASVLRGKGFAGQIEVLPLGYDQTLFWPGSQAVDSDEITLLLVGRLVPEKGVEDAVRTLAHLHMIRPTRLVVSGEGPAAVPARELAASLNVADRIEFRGWQTGPELAATYRGAHVVLVPSRATARWVEQFGRVIVEAQASGAVVAGYASGAIPEVAGEAGVLAPTGDARQLAEGVARVVRDADEFAWRRACGQRLAATRTWRSVVARQAALYQAVLAGETDPLGLTRSPRRRRAIARTEFGVTAATVGGVRPFALPLLRRGGAIPHALATVIDAAAELANR